jgi:hypothetical protein
MLLIIVFLPLFSVLLLSFYSRVLGHVIVARLATLSMGLTALCVILDAVKFFLSFDGTSINCGL